MRFCIYCSATRAIKAEMVNLKHIKHLALKVLVLFAALSTSACATKATHPTLKTENLPRSIPVRHFVANADYVGSFNLSPDGKHLAFEGVSQLRPAIRWRDIEGGKNHAVKFKKSSSYPYWSGDSRYILYVTDPSGKENFNVFAIDTHQPDKPAKNLTPTPGVRSYIHHIPNKDTNVIYLASNQRDPEYFDIYRHNIETGQQALLYKNENNIIDAFLNDEGEMKARVRQTTESRILEIPNETSWQTVITADGFDVIRVASLNSDGTSIYLLTNVNRDRVAAIEFDIATKEHTVLYEHPRVDVDGLYLSPNNKRPLMAFARPDYPLIHFFDDRLKGLLEPKFEAGENGLRIISVDRSENRLITSSFDETGNRFELIDLTTGNTTPLGESPSRKNADVLRPQTPISFTSRDGLTVHGYVTQPNISLNQPLPTVVLVHGGPWARDTWGYQNLSQFLANRGYAVLQINYRGSAGYGRQFLFSAAGEFAGKMHTDLIDGLDWAIDQGITDPEHVAIMGGSYGGYATLVGMTMTPERFSCGVDFVGMSDLALLWETIPTYWRPFMPFWEHFIGNPDNPADKKIMDSKSPVNFAHQVQGPLLIIHGANDPRVVLEHSDRMVAALKEHDKEVEYLVIDDEGHGFQHWKHQMTLYRKTEDFLANCLGGRSGGLDFYQLGSWAF